MSITDRIPGLKGSGSRRAVDKVAELEALVEELRGDIATLLNRQAASDDFFAVLLHDVTTTNTAWQKERQCRELAEVAVTQMETARNDWRAEALRLRNELAPYKAAQANANRVDVPCGIRDTSAVEDQATGPIYVQTLREAADAGLLGPVTDPGRVHTTT